MNYSEYYYCAHCGSKAAVTRTGRFVHWERLVETICGPGIVERTDGDTVLVFAVVRT